MILKDTAMAAGALAFLASTTALTPVALAQPAPKPPAARCAGLVGSRFDRLPDAPTEVISAKIVKDADLPEACEVAAYIAPQVTVAARLPTEGWNGKFLMTGCGGACGFLPNGPGSQYRDGLKRGYAVITTDMGHHNGGAPSNAIWSYDNVMAELDFGFRATHATAVLGKALVADFYGRPQQFAYFQGCSTGGRQALIEAQRYPDDFDGILAGAGTLYYATSGFQLLWSALANLDAQGRPIMTRPDVEVLHAAVVQACDKLDGLADGIIGDPRQCRFDVKSLICKAGPTSGCLTAEQAEVARRVYQGPVNSRGEQIHVGGAEFGSELNWLGDYFQDGAKPAAILPFMEHKFRYMTFAEDPGPGWTPKDIDWDNDPDRAAGLGSVYAASNPDLRKFKARGGKLIQYHGWTDENVIPKTSLDYYELATRTMGGPAATQAFYRLFMVPGMNHCRSGVGADDLDWLGALEAWVEKGEAPERLVGRHLEGGSVKFTRPYFPYPDVARYAGRGDPNQAENFKRIAP